MRLNMLSYKDYKQLLTKFKQSLLETFGSNLISLILFGSVARGTAGKDSDIDLLIILEDAPDAYHERLAPVVDIELGLREKAYEATGQAPMFSCIVLSKREAMENRNIFLDMLDASKILYDKDGFFKKRLDELRVRLSQLGSKKVILEDKTWYWNLKPNMSPGEEIEL